MVAWMQLPHTMTAAVVPVPVSAPPREDPYTSSSVLRQATNSQQQQYAAQDQTHYDENCLL